MIMINILIYWNFKSMDKILHSNIKLNVYNRIYYIEYTLITYLIFNILEFKHTKYQMINDTN